MHVLSWNEIVKTVYCPISLAGILLESNNSTLNFALNTRKFMNKFISLQTCYRCICIDIGSDAEILKTEMLAISLDEKESLYEQNLIKIDSSGLTIS